jgi:hypothetical protein
VTAGQDGMIARHPDLNGGVWSDQSKQRKGTKEVSLLWNENEVYQKSIQSRKDYLTSGLCLSRLFLWSLIVTQMLPTINLEQ